MYFSLIGLEVGLVLIGDHLLCWFFLGMLKLGAGSPVFFRISKRLIEGAIKEFRGFEAIGLAPFKLFQTRPSCQGTHN